MFFDRLIPVALSLTVSACGSLSGLPEAGSNRQAFLDGLAAEPHACEQYRDLYVQGFKTNVAALSDPDEALESEAGRILRQSRQVLAAAGVPPESCSRPYCIIEPLQNGRLDSWCGYRIAADHGDELYQWLNWSEASISGPNP